ncbi:MAG: restriction endonuclease subunit S [Nitrospira sp.]|nr:restriction endonuclease subunit S [Nitrospira sp.]
MKQGWPLKQVGELFDVQLGKMLSPNAREGEQLPYLANFNVQWGKFNLENVKSMHFTESEKEKYSLKQGDIIMCEGGEVGRCAIWKERSINFYYQKALHRLRPKDKNTINPYFTCIYMEHVTSNNGVAKIVGETSIAHLTREKLCALKIPCPSKEQQDKIVKIISTWDAAIEKTERLIAAKEKQFDVLILFLINKKCKKWAHHRVKDLLDNVSKRNAGNQELLSVTQDRGVIPRTMLEGRVMSPVGSTTNYKIVETGDFVISLRSFQGGIEYSRYRGAVSPAYTVLKTKKPLCDRFYRHFFKSHIFVNKYLGIAVIGIRDGKQISFPDFQSVNLPYPPLAEQKSIADSLDAAEQEMGLLKQVAEKYRTQKRGLMQKLLGGK